jgi:hypothetical protein
MARRTNRGIWKGSLIAACMLYGAFYALSYTGLGKFYLLPLIELSNIPTVTISMVISEFATIMSNLSSNWGWEACLTGIALLIYFLVGWWATRRTGYVKTGILAGLFYGLISFIIAAVRFLLSMQTFSRSFSNPIYSHMQTYTLAKDLIDNISVFLFGFLLYGLLAGFVGGLLGGLFGSRFHVPPRTPVLQQQEP